MTTTKPKPPAVRDLPQVTEALMAERRGLADAEAEVSDLRERRLARLVEASIDEVREIDEAIARADTQAEIAAARLVPLAAELERLRAAERDAVLERNLKAALALAEKAREALDRYAEHAAAIVVIFRELAALRGELDTLNERLPPGAARVEIEPPRWGGATLASSTVLPGVDFNEIGGGVDIWPTRARRMALTEVYRTLEGGHGS